MKYWEKMYMIFIILGVAAYIFFVLYDINCIVFKNKLLYCGFFTGLILLAAATGGIIVTSRKLIVLKSFRVVIFGTFAVLFLLLLMYTLFFALPFKDTYLETEGPHKVCQSGVYALCRHPGVLWFIGFYLFLGLALDLSLLFTAAIILSILDILYVIFQDRWTFVKNFVDYGEYKKITPFLLPNLKSLKRCLQTLKWKEGIIS